jgi:homoserine O-acetyltransferase/O-succinyltransferase
MHLYKHPSPFVTETGSIINGLGIAYHTYGTFNRERNNVVWICHALTANSDAADWWPGMVEEGRFYDPAKYFIVCANVLGSCYGTTGPLSVNPDTGSQYLHDFPEITIRDIVRANDLLREYHTTTSTRVHSESASINGQQTVYLNFKTTDQIYLVNVNNGITSETRKVAVIR